MCYILYIFYFQDFEIDNIDELCDKLKQLSTESHKYRAKRDRRQQKSSFRDILRAVQVMRLCVSDCNSRGREFDPVPVPYFRGD